MEDSTVDFPAPLSAAQKLKPGLRSPAKTLVIPKLLRIEPVEAGACLDSIMSGNFTFGRDDSCDMIIPDHFASRRHAEIICEDNKWLVVDLGSTNGTWVNEESIQIQPLRSGDRIRMGRWTFKFFVEDNVGTNCHESDGQMMTQDALAEAWSKRYLIDRELVRQKRSKEPLRWR